MAKRNRDKTGRFSKGHSGNSAGRPKGSRNRVKLLLGERLEDVVPELLDQLIEAARKGDTAIAPAIVRMAIGSDRQTPIQIDLPPIETPKDLVKVCAALTDAMRTGEIDSIGLDSVSLFLDRLSRMWELTEVEDLRQKIELLTEELKYYRRAKK